MNLQLIAIINEFLNKPARRDEELFKICMRIRDCGPDYGVRCECCLVGRSNGDKAKAVHTSLNQIQVTCEYTLTSNSK